MQAHSKIERHEFAPAGRGRTIAGVGRCGNCLPALVPGNNGLELFIEGDRLYSAMLESIAAAHKRVWLETYAFADDEIGWSFAEALSARARAGVDVRMHLDAAGSLFWSSRRIERYMQRNGVHVRWFHRWSWTDPLRYNRRNHRKLLVIDEEAAYLGGFNIHRECSRAIYGDARWRDAHLRVGGALVPQAAQLFADFWAHGRDWARPVNPETSAVILPNHSRRCRHCLRCMYSAVFADARRRIFLTTPYFVPDRRTQNALIDAAKRGVDVRVLVPRKNDVRLARWAARAAYGNLLFNGVQIFEYLPRMLHAKTAVIDGEWCIVGTANIDYRSFFTNHELNLFARDPILGASLEGEFEHDLGESERILPRRWRQRGWEEHLSESIGWLARRLL